MRNKGKETRDKNLFENCELNEILREGARKMLQAAIENEIEEHIFKYRTSVDADGKQLVTRNGYMPERTIHTGVGSLPITRPRIETYSDKYPKAVECLTKDKEHLFTFYDFPSVHWQHIRTTNPIESTFAKIRLRTQKTRGCGSRTATLTMVYKLALEAEKGWKKLKGYKMILLVLENRKFVDGELEGVA